MIYSSSVTMRSQNKFLIMIYPVTCTRSASVKLYLKVCGASIVPFPQVSKLTVKEHKWSGLHSKDVQLALNPEFLTPTSFLPHYTTPPCLIVAYKTGLALASGCDLKDTAEISLVAVLCLSYTSKGPLLKGL